MLRNITRGLSLARLPSQHLRGQNYRVTIDQPRNLTTDVPPTKRSYECPKIDRSRPLPPPAYAGSSMGNVSGVDDHQDDLTFHQPEYVDIDEPPKSGMDIRAMNHEFNLAPRGKHSKRPEFEFDPQARRDGSRKGDVDHP
jgi:hypothetical protein